MALKELNPLMNVAIDGLLKRDPIEWLLWQLTLTQKPMPKTVKEAQDMVRAKVKTAMDAYVELKTKGKKGKSTTILKELAK